MTYYTLLIVLASVPILACVRGNVVFGNSNEKLIIVDPLFSIGFPLPPISICNQARNQTFPEGVLRKFGMVT